MNATRTRTATITIALLSGVSTAQVCPFDLVAPSDIASSDAFGESVQVDRGWLAVAAPFDAFQADGFTVNGGSVALHRRIGGIWTETQRLFTAPSLQSGSSYGSGLALDDGLLLVGAPGFDLGFGSLNRNIGITDVYQFEGDRWEFAHTISNPFPIAESGFGADIDLSADRAIISSFSFGFSAPQGRAFIYFRNPATEEFELEQELIPTTPLPVNDRFASDVQISGDVAAVGTVGSGGAVYIFTRQPAGNWVETQVVRSPMPVPFEFFGRFISLDGNLLLAQTQSQSPAGSFLFERDGTGDFQSLAFIDNPAASNVFFGDVQGSSLFLVERSPTDPQLIEYQVTGGTVVEVERTSIPQFSQFGGSNDRIDADGRFVVLGDTSSDAAITNGGVAAVRDALAEAPDYEVIQATSEVSASIILAGTQYNLSTNISGALKLAASADCDDIRSVTVVGAIFEQAPDEPPIQLTLDDGSVVTLSDLLVTIDPDDPLDDSTPGLVGADGIADVLARYRVTAGIEIDAAGLAGLGLRAFVQVLTGNGLGDCGVGQPCIASGTTSMLPTSVSLGASPRSATASPSRQANDTLNAIGFDVAVDDVAAAFGVSPEFPLSVSGEGLLDADGDRVEPCLADVDGSGAVDVADVQSAVTLIQSSNLDFDLDDSATIDWLDLRQLLELAEQGCAASSRRPFERP